MISQDQYTQLTNIPNTDDLKEVVFSMNPNAAAGLDGMDVYFFQKCWHIIKNDLWNFYMPFLVDRWFLNYIPFFIVLLPKVNNPNKIT